MRRKTQRHQKYPTKQRKSHSHASQSIPELRQAFDYIDEFVKHRIQSGVSKEQIVKELRREWQRVFSKPIQKKNATAFVEHMMERVSKRRGLRGTRKRTRGGVAPFMDSTTQPSPYLAQGTPPTGAGNLPLANDQSSNYGSFPTYLSRGFQAPPEMAGLAKGEQNTYPTSAPNASNRVADLGSTMKGGRRRRLHGGSSTLVGSLFQQFTTRPIPSSDVPGPAQHLQASWYGRSMGAPSDQVQNTPNYHLKDTMFPKMIPVNIQF